MFTYTPPFRLTDEEARLLDTAADAIIRVYDERFNRARAQAIMHNTGRRSSFDLAWQHRLGCHGWDRERRRAAFWLLRAGLLVGAFPSAHARLAVQAFRARLAA